MSTSDLLPSKDNIAEALRQLTGPQQSAGPAAFCGRNLRRRDSDRRRARGPVRAEAGEELRKRLADESAVFANKIAKTDRGAEPPPASPRERTPTRWRENSVRGRSSCRRTAAATAVAIGMVALAALAYRLIDVFLLLFIGIAIAAALQPSHVKLCRWGIPKGLAVLLIYLLFLVGLVLIALVVGPVLIEQSRSFSTELPHTYATLRSRLQTSRLVRYS